MSELDQCNCLKLDVLVEVYVHKKWFKTMELMIRTLVGLAFVVPGIVGLCSGQARTRSRAARSDFSKPDPKFLEKQPKILEFT